MRHQLNPQLSPRGVPRHFRFGLGDSSAALSQAQSQVAAAQAAIQNAPQAGQDAWSNATGENANDARVQKGVSAAGSLITQGYDQNNPADEQKVVAVVAAGISLIPAVGPFLAGGLELLNQIALGIGDALTALGLIPKPGCQSSGTFTTANVLADWVSKGADVTPGTFGALAWPALAQNVALFKNCQKGGFDNALLLIGLVNVWNQTTGGIGVPVFAPSPSSFGEPYGFTAMGGGAYLNNGKGGITTPLASLFHPAQDFPGGAFPIGAATITVNSPSAAQAAVASTSKAGPAVGGAIAAAAVGGVVYSYVKGRAVGSFLESAFGSLTSLFK